MKIQVLPSSVLTASPFQISSAWSQDTTPLTYDVLLHRKLDLGHAVHQVPAQPGVLQQVVILDIAGLSWTGLANLCLVLERELLSPEVRSGKDIIRWSKTDPAGSRVW